MSGVLQRLNKISINKPISHIAIRNTMKQTAVEFLEQQIRYYIYDDDRLYDMFKQAKAMEKEQIIQAIIDTIVGSNKIYDKEYLLLLALS